MKDITFSEDETRILIYLLGKDRTLKEFKAYSFQTGILPYDKKLTWTENVKRTSQKLYRSKTGLITKLIASGIINRIQDRNSPHSKIGINIDKLLDAYLTRMKVTNKHGKQVCKRTIIANREKLFDLSTIKQITTIHWAKIGSRMAKVSVFGCMNLCLAYTYICSNLDSHYRNKVIVDNLVGLINSARLRMTKQQFNIQDEVLDIYDSRNIETWKHFTDEFYAKTPNQPGIPAFAAHYIFTTFAECFGKEAYDDEKILLTQGIYVKADAKQQSLFEYRSKGANVKSIYLFVGINEFLKVADVIDELIELFM